jgi:hypothetical protein
VSPVILGITDSLLFRPPAHAADVDRVVDVRIRTYPDFIELQDESTSFSGVAAYAPRTYAMDDRGSVVEVAALLVSGRFPYHTRSATAIGRFFRSADDRTGGPHVAVLSYAFAFARFADFSSALGRTVLADDLYTVVGVAPDSSARRGIRAGFLASLDYKV